MRSLDTQLDLPQGWFLPEEGRWYAARAAEAGAGVVVEVGCWKGRSTSFVAPVCRDNGAALWCVDSWRGSRDAYAEDYARLLAEEDVRAAFERNMAAIGCAPTVLAMDSLAAARSFASGSVDLVFIDASHDEESVLANLEAWAPALRPGGLLAGHDLSEKTPGVERGVERFCSARGLNWRRGPARLWHLQS
ncbi:MAG: class I SAM-dependent methyltransferase [Elusimicrobia bacterium]|nr:class I SAM-dependent methyltransferase [Elusimicrobiota bacterium]